MPLMTHGHCTMNVAEELSVLQTPVYSTPSWLSPGPAVTRQAFYAHTSLVQSDLDARESRLQHAGDAAHCGCSSHSEPRPLPAVAGQAGKAGGPVKRPHRLLSPAIGDGAMHR